MKQFMTICVAVALCVVVNAANGEANISGTITPTTWTDPWTTCGFDVIADTVNIVDAQSQGVTVSGTIGTLPENSQYWLEIGLIPKSVYDAPDFGFLPYIFNKGVTIYTEYDGASFEVGLLKEQSDPDAIYVYPVSNDGSISFSFTMMPSGSAGGSGTLIVDGTAGTLGASATLTYPQDLTESYLVGMVWVSSGNLDSVTVSAEVLPTPTEVWVDDDYTATGANDGHIWGYDAFDNIQDGIDVVVGSTVNVAAGTYNERLTINKSVTLLGAQAGISPTPDGARTNPSAESIVTEAGLSTPNPDVLIEIPSGITDVTIDGFTLNGDLTNPTADTSVVRCWDDNITISNNIIEGRLGVLYKGANGLTVDRNKMVVNKNGVVVQPSSASNIVISDNVFGLGDSPAGDESAIYLTSTSNSSVLGNTATGFINAKGIAGSNLNNLLVSDNIFSGNKDGVSFWGNTTFVTISYNVLSDCARYGINIKGQDIDIIGNVITGNGDMGVNIARNVIDTERVTLHCNNISANANYGVKVDTLSVMETVNAENNWWGDPSGPSGNGPGTGDAVSENVDFSPWLTSSPGDTCPPPPYYCVGFKPPMDEGAVKVKKNRVLPLKAELIDMEGYPLTDAEIIAPPVVQVVFQPTSGDAEDVTDDALPAGQGTEGNQFVFTGSNWQFNLKTKNYSAAGTYAVTMVSGNECEYTIESTCEAVFVIE
ncbi:MAG: right-handed parallel beta-helix repeat-containing protein [Planctomycetota bacterium]